MMPLKSNRNHDFRTHHYEHESFATNQTTTNNYGCKPKQTTFICVSIDSIQRDAKILLSSNQNQPNTLIKIELNSNQMMQMQRKLASLMNETEPNQSLNRETNTFARTIKSIFVNMMNSTHLQTIKRLNSHDQMQNESHNGQQSYLNDNQRNDTDNNKLDPVHGFDWPDSFIQLLNSLSIQQSIVNSISNSNDKTDPNNNNLDDNNDHDDADKKPVLSEIGEQNSNLVSRSPTTISSISSLAIDDRDFELMALQFNDPDGDNNSLWLMNFSNNNNNPFLPLLSTPINTPWPSPTTNMDLEILHSKPSNFAPTCHNLIKIDDDNNNNNNNMIVNNHDQNLINLMKFLAKKSASIEYLNGRQPFVGGLKKSTEQSIPLLGRKTRSLQFNQIISIDLNQFVPVETNNNSTQSITNEQDFDEDEQTAEERPADLVSGEKQDGSAGGTQLAPDLAKDCDHTLAQKDGSSSRKLSEDQQQQAGTNAGQAEDGKYSLLQFALYNFREAIDKYSLESRANKGQASGDTSTLRGSLKLIETLRNSSTGQLIVGKERKSSRLLASSGARVQSSGQSSRQADDWTWRELAEMVKFTQQPIRQSLLKLPSEDLNKRAVDCFNALMLYMGDSSGTSNSSKQPNLSFKGDEVECVYLILMNCHNFPILRDEVYCQLMKQTTNNRSSKADSCLRGWRLFSIVAAYFDCSETFKPYLVKYLETAAYDKRRAYCSIASLCLQNLRKTFKYGGRKNVPSIEEIAATSAGRNSKRQIYRLPGGTERVINTKSTTVVDDIIHEICSNMLNITEYDEMLEFSLYCIADGDLYTMPLNRDEYILDITTELIKNHQQYFLIFCRSIWHYPLRLDSKLYIEVIFNQIAPDYLEGLLLVLPNKTRARQSDPSKQQDSAQVQPLRLRSKLVREIARIAALLHRASGTDYMPHKDEIKYLLPKPIITAMKQYQRALGSGAQVEPIATTSSSSSSASSTSSVRNAGSLERAGSGHDTITTTPQKWIELVQNNWREMSAFDTLDAKAQFLDIVRHWPLFGSSFFAIKFIQRDLIQPLEFILALNKFGIQMLDMSTHETVHKYSFNEVISTRKVRSEDGALFLDLKCGNLMKRTIIRIQTDQAHEISRLIKQYIDIELLQQRQQKQVPCPSDTGSAVEFITQVIN